MSKYVTPELISLFVKTWNKYNGEQLYPNTINMGWCYQFAVVLKRLHGDKAQLCFDDNHAWVEIDGKYYDSKVIHGTEDVNRLACKRYGAVRRYVSEEEFIKVWGNGGSGDVQLFTINEVVNLYRVMR
jgi:hypothetical protein